jgi:hypothetical protein
VNKSRQENSDAPGIKAYIIFDKYWTDLNEATAMHLEAKAQIYTVKRTLTSKSSRWNVRRPWSTWKNSQKKKIAKSPTRK